MDEEFDTSVDTSSFDDISSDASDTGSFDDASDIVSVMDEAMDTTPLEVSEDMDTSLTDTSDDIGSIMDEVPYAVEELDIDETPVAEIDDIPLETESEIEGLMDDTEGISDGFSTSELTDASDTEFTEEVPEQSEIRLETDELSDGDVTDFSEEDSSEIDDLMNDAALEDILEEAEIMNEGETYDIPHDETSEIECDIDETSESEIENLMNETLPENLENPSQYETVGEFAPSEPGNFEALDMSDVSSFEEPMNEIKDVETTDAIEESSIDKPTETETSTYDNLYDYMSAHNYGREDFEVYSKDPEWQELNNAYRIEHGEEPIDYGQSSNDVSIQDMHEQVAEGWGIPEGSPEYDAIMQNEHSDIANIQSADVNSNFEDNIQQETDEYIPESDTIEDIENSLENAETVELTDHIPEREYDVFETLVMQDSPDFYESGSFYIQGINEYGYEGTCGPTSQANALNKLFDTNEFTENKVLDVAVSNNLCAIDSFPEDSGGTTTEQFMELYDKMNEQLGGNISTELHEYGSALDVNEVAQKLDEGSVLNVAVDSCALWDQPREYVNSMGIPQDDFYSDHWITVTGVQRDGLGNVQGFDIIDSGGGVDYVSADKYHEMCFGTDEHKVIDPTSIVVSKKMLHPKMENISAQKKRFL